MTDYREHHATIFVAPEAAGAIEAVRRAWDPDMAAQIAAHVTLAYPREAPLVDLLVERLQTACARLPPFRLRLGGLACFERPEDGVYLDVEDLDGGYRRMREAILHPPFQAATFPPHVTLVHPRTSRRGRDFWETGWHHEGHAFTADEIAITAFDGARWPVLARFVLMGGAGRLS